MLFETLQRVLGKEAEPDWVQFQGAVQCAGRQCEVGMLLTIAGLALSQQQGCKDNDVVHASDSQAVPVHGGHLARESGHNLTEQVGNGFNPNSMAMKLDSGPAGYFRSSPLAQRHFVSSYQNSNSFKLPSLVKPSWWVKLARLWWVDVANPKVTGHGFLDMP